MTGDGVDALNVSAAELRLSEATAANVPAIVKLVNHAFRGDEGWTREGHLIGGQRTDAHKIKADLAATPTARLLVLQQGGQDDILGVCWLDSGSAETWYIGMITVRADLQSQRLGRVLLARAEAYVVAHGGKRARMTVIDQRETLIAWYERRGYQRTGETEPFPYGDERFGLPKRSGLYFVVLERNLAAVAQ